MASTNNKAGNMNCAKGLPTLRYEIRSNIQYRVPNLKTITIILIFTISVYLPCGGCLDREIFSRDPIPHSNLPFAPSALPGPHAWQCLAFGEPDEPRQLQKTDILSN